MSKTRLPSILSNLAIALSDLNTNTGSIYYLKQAITLWRRSIDLSDKESPHILFAIAGLGDGLKDAYHQTGSRPYLTEAIELLKSAKVVPGRGRHFAENQNNLGNALKDMFELTGNLSDLEGSLEAYQRSIENTGDESPNLPTRLSNLGSIYRIRYLCTNDPNDLEKSIQLLNKSRDILCNTNSSLLPKINNNLGNSYHQRFLRTRNVEDLIKAKLFLKNAVDSTQEGNIFLPIYLTSLANVLDDLHLIEEAIGYLKMALRLTSRSSPEMPIILNTLGVVSRDRYLISDDPDALDLKNAIAFWNEALELLDGNSPHLPIVLNNLALALHLVDSRQTYYSTRLDDAIEKLYNATKLMPKDSSYLPIILNNLGNLLLVRYENKKTILDLEEALKAFVDAQCALDKSFALSPIDQKIGIRNAWEFIDGQLIDTAIKLMDISVTERRSSYCQLALIAAEGSKSRLLTEFVGRGDLDIPPSIPRPIFLKENELLKKLVQIDTKELSIIGKSTKIDAGPDYKIALLEERRKLMKELHQIWQEIEKLGAEGTRFVALRRGEKPSWKEISDFSRDAGKETAFISLYIFDNIIYIFSLRNGV